MDLKCRLRFLQLLSTPLLRLLNPWREHFGFLSFACVTTFTGSPFLQVFSFCSSSCCCRRVSPQAKLSWVARKAGKHLLTKVIRNALTDALAGLISLRFHLWRRAPVLHLARWLGALILYQTPKLVGIPPRVSCGITPRHISHGKTDYALKELFHLQRSGEIALTAADQNVDVWGG